MQKCISIIFILALITTNDASKNLSNEEPYQGMSECASVRRTISPKVFNNIHNVSKKIADPQLTIVVEECINKFSNCSTSPSIRSMCRQNYLEIRLNTLDENEQLQQDTFYYPSSCTCATFRKTPEDDY